MLADVQPSVLITTSALLDRLPPHDGHVIRLDTETTALDKASTCNPQPAAQAQDVAYIMYTSGSQGVPKGVSVTHRGVVRLVANVDYVKLGPQEVFLQLAPISFDASTFEIWGCLLHGGRLVLMPPHPPTLEEIGAAILDNRVTTLWLTTALFNLMVDNRLADLCEVRQLCTGGDVVSVSHAQRVLEQAAPGCRLLNLYGPTECTTFATCHTIGAEDLQLASLPIGRPITNTQTYVLDRYMQPLPVGIPGELYIGGDGLAAGYWNQPGLTAERFVRNPFHTEADSRLYRTGDQARWRADGTLEFLGRRDRQVKIRGFRIELAEIETALTRHPAVSGAVIVVDVDDAGDKHLAAYVARHPGNTLTKRELRNFLACKLPAYLIPSQWTLLDSLPQSPAGKIDRSALAAAAQRSGKSDVPYVAPRTTTENFLAETWAEVLGLDRVGIHDDFFECGGHSLRAAAASARIYKSHGVEISLQQVFERPTIAMLAEWLDAQSVATGHRDQPTLSPAESNRPVPASCTQEGLWVVEQMVSGTGAYNVPVALRIDGPLDVDVLERCLQTIVARHEPLRTVFRDSEGMLRQMVCSEWRFALSRVDLRDTPEADRDKQCWEFLSGEAERPFDLGTDLMLRGALVRLSDQEHALLLVMHHIASDGWSVHVLLRELGTLYTAYRAKQPCPLAELPLRFADFAVAQRDKLNNQSLQAQLAFWREQLRRAPPLVSLPTDHPRPPVLRYRGAIQRAALNPRLVERLARFARDENATLFMVLLAAFQTLVQRRSGQMDIVVGTPVAGRNRLELEALIGFFVNMVAIRVNLAGDPGFREVLSRVRQASLAALGNQDLPFDRVVHELQPHRSLSHMPLFQIAFAMQYLPRAQWSCQELSIEECPIDTGTARYDLTILLQESDSPAFEINAEYSRDLFEPATIARLLEEWQGLLEAILDDPDQPISLLTMPRTLGHSTRTTGGVNATHDEVTGVGSRSLPQTATERMLAKIWTELLHVPDIRLNDDFFELGGNSLQAIRLFAEIHRACGKRLKYASFFERPTLAHLRVAWTMRTTNRKLRSSRFRPAARSVRCFSATRSAESSSIGSNSCKASAATIRHLVFRRPTLTGPPSAKTASRIWRPIAWTNYFGSSQRVLIAWRAFRSAACSPTRWPDNCASRTRGGVVSNHRHGPRLASSGILDRADARGAGLPY